MGRKLPLVVLGAVALFYVALLATQPAPADWRPDYGGSSARPLGADILRELLPHALAGGGAPAAVRDIAAPPFVHLGEPRGDTSYVFVAHHFAPDEAESARLLAHARAGSTIFVAASQFEGPFADSLGAHELAKAGLASSLRVKHRGPAVSPADSALHLTAAALARGPGYRFPFAVGLSVLDGVDTSRSDVLATGRDGGAVLVRIVHGRGALLVSSEPDVFSNAALAGADGRPTDGPAFVADVLAYLPAGPAFWDEYVKPRRAVSSSPLRFVLSRPPLRMAYALAVLGVMAYVLFRGRRWQRPIPVVAPPPNAAAEFVRTVGRLHFQHGDHRALVERRTRYAIDRLRTRMGVADADLSPETEARLVKRGLPADVVAEAFARLRAAPGRIGPADLLALDRALERLWEAAD